MIAARFKKGSTGENVSALIAVIQDPNSREVRFFSSPRTKTARYSDSSDGPDNNLPLVAALVRYSIPRVDDVYIVFDGMFLTAARATRYYEVKELLDVAESSGKVVFSEEAADFTSSLKPEEAVKFLGALSKLILLTPATRAKYFGQLSNVSEAQFLRT